MEKIAQTNSLDDFLRIYSEKSHEEVKKMIFKNPGYLLISELAWGDLNNFLKTFKLDYSDETFWTCLISDIFKAIGHLQKYLNVVHYDLHLGNILVLMEDNHMKILIHDFGRSYKVNKWTHYDRLFDVEKVCGAFLFLEIFPEIMKNKVNNLLGFINELEREDYFIDEILNNFI